MLNADEFTFYLSTGIGRFNGKNLIIEDSDKCKSYVQAFNKLSFLIDRHAHYGEIVCFSRCGCVGPGPFRFRYLNGCKCKDPNAQGRGAGA